MKKKIKIQFGLPCAAIIHPLGWNCPECLFPSRWVKHKYNFHERSIFGNHHIFQLLGWRLNVKKGVIFQVVIFSTNAMPSYSLWQRKEIYWQYQHRWWRFEAKGRPNLNTHFPIDDPCKFSFNSYSYVVKVFRMLSECFKTWNGLVKSILSNYQKMIQFMFVSFLKIKLICHES
jgi:hypothetical protein